MKIIGTKRKSSQSAVWLLEVFLCAPAMAATFQVEIDYMGPDTDGHDHMPSQTVLNAVIQMFACQGHTLILELSDEVPHYDTLTGNPSSDCSGLFTYTGATNTFRSIRNTYRDRGAGWHYCIFAHNYLRSSDPALGESAGCYSTSSSGYAEGTDDFIVTLGSWAGQTGTDMEQAGTLAHELGHNLGLRHCGASGCTANHWPNHPSVMNYHFQTGGVRTGLLALGLSFEDSLFKELDYSNGRMCNLNENDLDEVRGTLMMSVDFNCNDVASSPDVVQDLNFGGWGVGIGAPWCGHSDDGRTVGTDYDEWNNLNDGADLLALADVGNEDAKAELLDREKRAEPCLSYEEWEKVLAQLNHPAVSRGLVVEACIGGENNYISPLIVAAGNATGACTVPYYGIQSAQLASPSGSVFYIVPSIYDEPGTTILDKPAVWSCNTGTAEIK